MNDRSSLSISILQKSLDAAWLRNQVISENIANAGTPGYKKKTVEFESLLKEQIEHSKGINEQTLQNIRPKVVQSSNLQMRLDENNVDAEVEMVNEAKNSIRYDTLIEQMNQQFQRIKTVLNSK